MSKKKHPIFPRTYYYIGSYPFPTGQRHCSDCMDAQLICVFIVRIWHDQAVKLWHPASRVPWSEYPLHDQWIPLLFHKNLLFIFIHSFCMITMKGPAQARVSTDIFHDGFRRETCSDARITLAQYPIILTVHSVCKLFKGYLRCGMILNVWTKLYWYPACLSYLSEYGFYIPLVACSVYGNLTCFVYTVNNLYISAHSHLRG